VCKHLADACPHACVQDRIARLNGRTVEFVVQQDRAAFLRLVWISVFQAVGSAMLAPLLKYSTNALALSWRQRLSEHVHKSYLKDNTACALGQLAGLVDADQRVATGVEQVSQDLAELVPTVVKPVFDIVWFSWNMGMLTGATGLACLYGCVLPERAVLLCPMASMQPRLRFASEAEPIGVQVLLRLLFHSA
jgi:ABC-type uncharacterized transport system fused permease/ATPase subunit